MRITENPAARLHTILADLKAQRQPLGVAWAGVLAIPQSDRAALMEALAALLRLPGMAETAIAAVPNVSHDLYTSWSQAVRQALSIAHQWESMSDNLSNQYSDKDLFALEVCADVLERNVAYAGIETDALEDAAVQVASLIEALVGAEDLDEAVRARLVRQAGHLGLAISLARVGGTQGIEDAVSGALGTAGQIATQRPDQRNKPAFIRFLEVTTVVANAVTIATGAAVISPAIAETVRQITGG